ncbi:cytochrome-c peroxidase [Agrobacterium rubi]|uniref:Cytochrome-c peroxidase n=1 Tax=Agrobacterium rubi TaxID=28099 RepID=A0AAE7RA88_9HYPH|nr:cytochrome-c peroxidase [Agrobacterium rubi]NTE87591.1 cytochrome-c peroxidase [Agrobacterium rubi]NTF03445.1 cytochrome-c peroxidase [Agrobacterium rubi]NTF37605.1 cytochrome-c peroxidase [Agrobacterium rubi]OCJ45701.1 methylamine utilization protein MauG [Agrobacterium rubi]QTG00229.1 cytochrome-c peroxidase [Agrobacterium rubi]
MIRHIICVISACVFSFVPAGLGTGTFAHGGEDYATLEKLGAALFDDPNLSMNRTMSCSTCHMPGAGFTDGRDTGGPIGHDVSLGDDGTSLGDRNTPSAAYASFSPPFGKNALGEYVGGQFWDGRASSLEDQAAGPPLNPIEMGMPDKTTIAKRLQENPDYAAAFGTQFGGDVFKTDDAAFAAMTKALAAFERTDTFSTFDSKYDRFLRGEEKLTDQEELGRVLMSSTQFTNCNTCHELKGPNGLSNGLFTNHKYFNIGVPANKAARAANGSKPDAVDLGLAQNPAVAGDPAQRGKFKVPTLRNVAVTGPYMHNGVFKDLRTVVLFYVKYKSKKPSRQVNPETGQAWDAPEVPENIAMTELTAAPALDDKRVDAIVAFLKTLTDKRYEHLLPKDDTGQGATPPAQNVSIKPTAP